MTNHRCLTCERDALFETLSVIPALCDETRLAVNTLTTSKPGRDMDAAAAVVRGHCLSLQRYVEGRLQSLASFGVPSTPSTPQPQPAKP